MGVAAHVSCNHRVLAGKWWIPYDPIEARVLPLEHLRELDLPVKRRKRLLGVPPLLEPATVGLSLTAHDRIGVRAPLSLSLLGLLPLEERRYHKVAEESHLTKLELRLVPQVTSLTVGDALVCFPDALAALGDLCHVLAHLHGLETHLKQRGVRNPVERLDLLP